MSFVRLISICEKDSVELFDQCQRPIHIDEDFTMKLQFDQDYFSCNEENIDKTSSIYQTFLKTYHQYTDEELESTLNISITQIKEYLPRCISCIGCRTSIDHFLKTILEYRYQVLEPFILTKENLFILKQSYRLSPEYLYSLFYIHNERLKSFIETIPKSKKNRRCHIHSLEKNKFFNDWQFTWNLMNDECRDELTLVETDRLLDLLETYLHKHRFCSECKLKVFEAYDLLLDNTHNDHSSIFYERLKLCTNTKHIHIQSNQEFLEKLIFRVQLELDDCHRERHAKTIEIAQEEILICIGIYFYERLEKISRLIKSEEQIWKFVFSIIIDCLRLNFETNKNKQNWNLCEEFSLNENRKSSKKSKKKKSSSLIKSQSYPFTFVEHNNPLSSSLETLVSSISTPACLCNTNFKFQSCLQCSSTRTDLGYSSDSSTISSDFCRIIELTDRNRKVKLKIELCDQYPFFNMDFKHIWDESPPLNSDSISFISDVDLQEFLSLHSSLEEKRAKLHESLKLKFQIRQQKAQF